MGDELALARCSHPSPRPSRAQAVTRSRTTPSRARPFTTSPVGIELPAAHGEARPHRVLVVVVLHHLAHHHELERQHVPRVVLAVEVAVTEPVPEPVHQEAVDGSHEEVDRHQRPQKGWREEDVEGAVEDAPAELTRQPPAEPVEQGPLRVAAFEARLGGDAAVRQVVERAPGGQHQPERAAVVVGGVRVAWPVAVGVMRAMQQGVGPRRQVARPERQVHPEMEDALPPLRHRELPVGAVAVQEERLEEGGERPMDDEEDQNEQHRSSLRARRIAAAVPCRVPLRGAPAGCRMRCVLQRCSPVR